MILTQERQQAYALIDLLPFAKLGAVPKSAPSVLDEDNEALSPAEAKAIAEAEAWSKHHNPIPHEEVLSEFCPYYGRLGEDEPPAVASMAKHIFWTEQARAYLRAICDAPC